MHICILDTYTYWGLHKGLVCKDSKPSTRIPSGSDLCYPKLRDTRQARFFRELATTNGTPKRRENLSGNRMLLHYTMTLHYTVLYYTMLYYTLLYYGFWGQRKVAWRREVVLKAVEGRQAGVNGASLPLYLPAAKPLVGSPGAGGTQGKNTTKSEYSEASEPYLRPWVQ